MTPIWCPIQGQQSQALNTEADILLYGGAAGGGKTDLGIGAALTHHIRSIIYRRESVQLQGIVDRIAEIYGNRDGYNSQLKIWRLPDKQVELGSCKNAGDEIAYQGRPHDLKVFDEITHFLESQFRFLAGWLRSNKPGQRKRIICTGNPPTDSDGQWVKEYWGAWLDENHPNSALPGELRWYTTDPETGKDIECGGGDPIEIDGEMVQPISRTFIPSSVEDNPFLIGTGYKAILQALPEPLRSQMLKGNFNAGSEDNPWQVIPTEWVKAAQARWKPRTKKGVLDSMGVDVARGGRDETVIANRHDVWFDEPIAYPGEATPNGAIVASLVVTNRKDKAPVHVDVIGVGTSVVDHLEGNEIHTVPVNNAASIDEKDKTGQLGFYNVRAMDYWRMREELDPLNDTGIELPDNSKLRADLCCARWKLTARGIQVESKEEIIKRLKRSTDYGDAYILANRKTKKKDNAFTKPLKIDRSYIV